MIKKTSVNDFPFIHTQNKDFIFNYFQTFSEKIKQQLGFQE